MAQNPIGTVTDEERLVPLLERGGALVVDVTDPVRTADLPEGGTFAWRLREEGDVPRLAFAPVDDADDAGSLPTRELSAADETLALEVPEPLLADGLGLDTGAYDDDDPLLFKPEVIDEGVAVGMGAEGEAAGTVKSGIELVPVRFADGTPYRAEPVSESLDSDPVAEAELAHQGGDRAAPRPETMSAPIRADVAEAVLESTAASRAEVIVVLETMARRNLVGEGDDDTEGDPLAVDDGVVVALDDEDWARNVAAELDFDDAAVEAAREIHERQAAELLRTSGAEKAGYEDRTPVVLEPDHE